MSWVLPAAAMCGFVVREAMAIIPAIPENENTPDKFSFLYYFSRPKNRVLLVANGAGALALMLGHAEVTTLMAKIPVVGPYFDGVTMPVLTGVLIGFGGAWIFRVLFAKMSG